MSLTPLLSFLFDYLFHVKLGSNPYFYFYGLFVIKNFSQKIFIALSSPFIIMLNP